MTLAADALVASAVAETGLDDFGEGPWRDGLDVFCAALDREADLNDMGVAVQSRAFSVGLCAWARPGVGAIATQAFTEGGPPARRTAH